MDKAPRFIPTSQSPLDLVLLLDKVNQRLKVKEAVILDLHGNVLHATPSWPLLLDDGHKMAKVLSVAPTPGLWKVFIFGQDFHCFHCDSDQTVLGTSATKVMAAHMTRKHIVVGLASERDPGSCLYEMKLVWSELEARGL
ncbi:uncharacterized protein [Littorina saxatilis]